MPFDFERPPMIEGFSPLPRAKDETFKEKFTRKTKENPFVPIGQLHKLRNTEPSCYRVWNNLLSIYKWHIHKKIVEDWLKVIISAES